MLVSIAAARTGRNASVRGMSESVEEKVIRGFIETAEERSAVTPQRRGAIEATWPELLRLATLALEGLRLEGAKGRALERLRIAEEMLAPQGDIFNDAMTQEGNVALGQVKAAIEELEGEAHDVPEVREVRPPAATAPKAR